MTKQVKKLEETLHSCEGCPYLMFSSLMWLCGHDDGEGEIKTDVKKEFPDWCPVDNTKDPGVRVGLTALILRDGKILLGKRKNTETADGKWAFPGGRMDYGEDPKEGAMREVFEETGIKANPFQTNYLTYKNEFFPEEKKHYVSLVFLVLDSEGEPELREPDKCDGWKWFDPFDLPENTFWTCSEAIQACKHIIKTSIIEQEKKEILERIKEIDK